ncbi:MAG: hypothetical protein HOC71_00125, partial [Candidatus Latescibacteria bacterium]|nr:hypothetical protein [Candidatus Latescibacterota bacterium]
MKRFMVWLKVTSVLMMVMLNGEAVFGENITPERDSRILKMASERWHTWRQNRKTFPLAAWSYFKRFPGTPEEYETYRDANLTMVMPPLDQYNNAISTGLEIILGHFEPLHEDRELLEKMVNFPSPQDRSVTAYMVKDEPLVEDYPAVGRAVEYIYEHDRRDA